MAITFELKDLCSGDHGEFSIIIDGKVYKTMISKKEMSSQLTIEEFENGVKLLLKYLKTEAKVTTWSTLKAALSTKAVG